MTIALDATYSVGGDLSGVGHYSREILNGMAAAHPQAAFRFCYRPHRFLRSWREPVPANAARRLLIDAVPIRAGVFHGLNQRLPRSLYSRAVTTFHDLFVLTGDYSSPVFRARFAAQARDAAARSDAIIAVSAFTASQVEALLGVERARIHVVHHGVRAIPLPAAARENIVLHVGAVQKRKNLVRLIEAFEALPSEWQLVLAGSLDGFGAAEVLARFESSPARRRILLTGYLSDSQLAAWYARARIFAFPSLDEGFGMPVLEAMAAGVPVVASNRGALPEVCGNAAVLVDAASTPHLAAALQMLAASVEARRNYSEQGKHRAEQFSWDQAVQQTWAVYGRVI